MPTAEQLREWNARFVDEVFNRQNLEYASEAIADDFQEHQDLPPGLTADKQGALAFFAMFFESSPDMRAEITQTIVGGDRVATLGIFSGTDTGGSSGNPPTNRPYAVESIDIARWNDAGQLVEHWGIFDTMSMMGQLGLLPDPPP